jgi:hypothetical protein
VALSWPDNVNGPGVDIPILEGEYHLYSERCVAVPSFFSKAYFRYSLIMFNPTRELRVDPFREAQDFEVPTFGSVMDASPLPAHQGWDFPKTVPTPDNRYPDRASKMADGRLITDYRPSCVSRVPYGHQNATKGWLVKNAEEVIRVGRIRQAENSGAVYGAQYMGPPPAAVQECSVYGCSYRPGVAGGVGVERAHGKIEELPGTFDPQSVLSQGFPRERAGLTRKFEGGRNSGVGGRTVI